MSNSAPRPAAAVFSTSTPSAISRPAPHPRDEPVTVKVRSLRPMACRRFRRRGRQLHAQRQRQHERGDGRRSDHPHRALANGPIETLKWEGSSAWLGSRPIRLRRRSRTRCAGVVGHEDVRAGGDPGEPPGEEIPPITFSFFDPAQRRYCTISHPAHPSRSRLRRSPWLNPWCGRHERGNAAARGDRHRPHQEPAGVLAQMAPPWVERPGFLLLQCVPLAGWLAALAWPACQGPPGQ